MSGSAVEYVEIKLTFERTFRGKSPLVKLVYIAIMTHILQARVVTHVLARVLTHVLARVIMHVHDYYLKTCVQGGVRGSRGVPGRSAPAEAPEVSRTHVFK